MKASRFGIEELERMRQMIKDATTITVKCDELTNEEDMKDEYNIIIRKIVTNVQGIDKYIQSFIKFISENGEYHTKDNKRAKVSDMTKVLISSMDPDTIWIYKSRVNLNIYMSDLLMAIKTDINFQYLYNDVWIDMIGKIKIYVIVPVCKSWIDILIDVGIDGEESATYFLSNRFGLL